MTLPSTVTIAQTRAVRDHLKTRLRGRKDVHDIIVAWRNGSYTVVVAVDSPETSTFLPASIDGVPIHKGQAPSLTSAFNRGGR